jgi:hypothetical protein
VVLPTMSWSKQGFSCAVWVNMDGARPGKKTTPGVRVPGAAVVTEKLSLRECVLKVRQESGAGFEVRPCFFSQHQHQHQHLHQL